ncbi:MAG TPA: hypothetical protein PK748_03020, partial [Acidimicrobiales bacterium]|nr:hypothetical protein [Acidimicrobiales bacterium]
AEEMLAEAARQPKPGSGTRYETPPAAEPRAPSRPTARAQASLGGDIARWALQEHPGLVSGALRGASRRLPTHVDLPAAHQGLPSEDLHRVGFTDAPTAAQVWTRERAAAHRWLAEALRSESTRSTLSPG